MFAAANTQTFDGFHGISLSLLVAGVILVVAWLAVFGVRYLATFPKMPRAAADTNELGPEPPAVVNLLVNRWKTTRTAMAATLLDLAARKIIDIQQLDRNHFVIHLERVPTDETTLTDYERQMLDFIRARATGGSAPVEALSMGEEAEARAWWKRFSDSVAKDARRLGLARGRWAGADWTLLGGLLLVALAALALALLLAHAGELGAGSTTNNNDNFSPSDWLIVGAAVWLAVMAWLRSLRGLRDTEDGRKACAHWLGVRGYLRQTNAFDELPPAAVVIWERFLAYGAAVGAAHDAVHALPFEAEEPGTAWSRKTGMWRQLRIEYPHRFGFGASPARVFLHGLAGSLFWGALAFAGVPLLATVAYRLFNDALTTTEQDKNHLYLVVGLAAFVIVVGGYLLVRFLASFIRLLFGASDLGKHITLEGPVIKVHDRRVAIDDGKSDEAIAWYPPPGSPTLVRGMDIRAVMSPRLRHVTSVTVLSTAVAPVIDASSAVATGTVPAVAPAIALTAAAVREITGLDLPAIDPSHARGSGSFQFPGASTAAFSDGKDFVAVAVAPANSIAVKMFSTVTRLPGLHAQPVDGLGDAAFWLGGHTLVTQHPGNFSIVQATLHGVDANRLLGIARALTLRLGGDTAPAVAGAVSSPPAVS